MDQFKLFAIADFDSGFSSGASSGNLVSGQGARFPTRAFWGIIWNRTDYDSPHEAFLSGAAEVSRCTRSSDVITFTQRGAQGTTALNHNTGGKTYAFAQVSTPVDYIARRLITDVTGAVKLLIAGNSIAMNPDPIESGWPYKLTQLPAFAGRDCTLVNTAEFGITLADWESNFDDNIAPHAPAPGDFVALIILFGHNDYLVGDTPEESAETCFDNVAALSAAARALGIFTVIVTTTPRATSDAEEAAFYEAARTIGNNRLLTEGTAICDMVADMASLMPNNLDTTLFAEGTHHTQLGRDLFAYFLNALFVAGGSLLGGPFPGQGPGNVPTNRQLRETPRTYSAQQNVGTVELDEDVLDDDDNVLWNANTAPNARVLLTANASFGLPLNAVDGATYKLSIVQDGTGGNTATFDEDVYAGLPTIDDTENLVTVLLFHFDGLKMLCVGSNSYEGSTGGGGDPTLIIHEEFTVDGYNNEVITFTANGRWVNGTPPLTVNTPGHNWGGQANDSTGAIVLDSASGNARFQNAPYFSVIDAEISDGTVASLIKWADSSGSGQAGILIRSSDSNNLILFGGRGDGTYQIWKINAGSYSSLATGTFTYNSSDGNTFKCIMAGNTLQFYIDADLKETLTESFNNTVTKHGVGMINSCPVRLQDFKVWTA